jgi:hypothetical protein
MDRASKGDLHPDRPPAFEHQAKNERRRKDREVRSIHQGIDIRVKQRKPQTIANQKVGQSRSAFTLHHASVGIVESLNSK